MSRSDVKAHCAGPKPKGNGPSRAVPVRAEGGASAQAAVSHMAVSNALLISGMFMPKFGLVPFFDTATFGAGLSFAIWAISARSPGPISRERATEKNRNT
jgi:hypothetical protein